MPRFVDPLLRVLLTAAFALLKHRVCGRPGLHAVALTPAGRVVLLKLRYAAGWRLPGGGLHDGEVRAEAALRELEEEIGMTGHGAIAHVEVGRDPLLIVRDVRFTPPRWSWEVEQIVEADLDALPDDMAPVARRWLAAVGPRL
jgi:8-oxo-dGTP pyrophosphatase MutT (NUDIX family)